MRILVLTFLLSILYCSSTTAQRWNTVEESTIQVKGKRDIIPITYLIMGADDPSLKDILWNAPSENQVREGSTKTTLLNLPLADGSYQEFSIYSYEMMEEDLARKYPNIRTFKGKALDNPSRSVRIDYTSHGLRAVINDEGRRIYIDHYQRNDKIHKIIYTKEDYTNNKGWSCEVEATKDEFYVQPKKGSSNKTLGDCELRTYRYSQTATGEYSNFHGASSAAQSGLVLSAVTTTMNRVNEIFEMDLSTRFILIANTDLLFYYDPTSDPFNGNSASNMIGLNQTVTDDIIGSANYDIGHIFSTGGSGLAGLGVVCTGGKARGVTGIGSPVGDPFDIDYVAHEIGHQCGGNHTQNNSCNRSGTSVEVGSGFTIMGYAGICPPNVTEESIAIFNGSNITEMSAFLNSASCAQTVMLSNQSPDVMPIDDKVIPASTPFLLYAPTTDPSNDVLYYAWEQADPEAVQMPPVSTNIAGPTFRGFLPSTDSVRYFPRLENLSTGGSDQWEVLPSVTREMNFLLTVRDRVEMVGCVDTTSVTLDVDGNSGPFIVTSQTSTFSIPEYDTLPVTWNVANTVGGLVAEKKVDILLSRDSGLSFTEVLATGRYNDGKETITMPQGLNSSSRIMVKGSDNYFFNINSADFNITNGGASYGIVLSEYFHVLCGNAPVVIDINSTSFEGFTGNIALSVANLPPGVTSTLGQSSIAAGNSTTLTLDNFVGLAGIYEIDIDATSGGISRTEKFVLEVAVLGATTLLSPADGAIDMLSNPIFTWDIVNNAVQYEYEIYNATNTVLIESGVVSQAQKALDIGLAPNTTYNWRVRPIFDCGNGAFTASSSFTTASCFLYEQRTSVLIPQTASTQESTVNLPYAGSITDVNIIDLDITHSWIGDLEITLESPATSQVILFNNSCGEDDNILLSYDDAAGTSILCPPTGGGTFQPTGSLASLNTEDPSGTWKLIIEDSQNQDGGSLNSWTLEVCYSSTCDLVVTKNTFDDGSGSLKDAIDCATSGDEITLSPSLANTTIDLQTESLLIAKGLSIVANPADNITITSSSTASTLALASGINLNLTGFTIVNTTTSTGVISNEGILVLDEMTVTSGAGKDGVISTAGTVDVKATCTIGN